MAANILWEKANDYQMKKDWANRAATLNQITKVQPNFINVWLNQAWNVSYNISVQFPTTTASATAGSSRASTSSRKASPTTSASRGCNTSWAG